MKQTLQLKLGQHLTMTPQLQQAIRLLQLSTLELQTEIQEALESNPLLELAEEGGEGSFGDAPAAPVSERETAEGEAEVPEAKELGAADGDDLPDDLPTDSAWEDTFDMPTASKATSDDDDRSYEGPVTTEQNLIEYLTWQMQLTPFSDTDRAVATAILDAIDDDGYLTESVEQILESLGDDSLELDEVQAVLRQIQNFDPPGVAARSLQEAMLLQLQRFPPDTPWLREASAIVADHFDLLAGRDYATLMRRTKLKEPEMQQALHLIQSLNPRPGGQLSTNTPEYIVPDVFARKVRNRWRVELNPEVTPRLSINQMYADIAQRNNAGDSGYLKNQLQEARWLINSLKSRNETLIKVAQCIVDRQRGFLDYGAEAMKPLVMSDIAQTVEMHESTISRVTTKKYLHTPRGIFELKYFFSSHVGTAAGGECSSTAIRAIIKKLVAAEKPTKPLSDSKLASLLEGQGINVARRTIAKYRESLGIPPSNERKRLI